jgi:hypothetical protein
MHRWTSDDDGRGGYERDRRAVRVRSCAMTPSGSAATGLRLRVTSAPAATDLAALHV